MPIHLSRRGFFKSTAAVSATILTFRPADGAERDVDHDLIALLNDSHVSENTAMAPNGQNISENLAHAVNYLLGVPRCPPAVFINGDLAHNKGLSGDYRQLAKLIRPLTEAGIELHLTMGNHDDRAAFFDVLGEHQAASPPVASKHVAVVRTRRANFFLLDSLTETNVVIGELGTEQRSWLLRALDAHADRPAILVVHHDPQFKPNGPEAKFVWSGLRDATTLFDSISTRRHVKAYVHGHVHSWGLSRRNDLHVVNTPAVGYVGKDGPTTGWTMCRLRDGGATLTTYTINATHSWHDKSHKLTWRT